MRIPKWVRYHAPVGSAATVISTLVALGLWKLPNAPSVAVAGPYLFTAVVGLIGYAALRAFVSREIAKATAGVQSDAALALRMLRNPRRLRKLLDMAQLGSNAGLLNAPKLSTAEWDALNLAQALGVANVEKAADGAVTWTMREEDDKQPKAPALIAIPGSLFGLY